MRREIFEDEHDAFRESVAGFLRREAVPRGEEWEAAGIIDRDFWRKAAAQGFVAFQAPEELGGAGIEDFRFNAVIDEEVERTGTVTDNFALVNDIVTPYLTEIADEEQRRRWLPGVARGAPLPALALTAPRPGAARRGLAAQAGGRGDHWSLTGSKTFVTSGIQADLVIVAARAEREGVDGLGLFAVAADAEGFSRGRKLDKVGRKAQDTAELFFDEVAVPEADVIGEPGEGLRLLMRNLSQERLSIAVSAVASAERALEVTLEYVRDRNAFGKPVGSFQANRFALAEAATEVEIARVFVDRCIAAPGAGERGAEQAAGAKYWTTDLQFQVADLGMQLHGGYGYMEEYEIARIWRDSRVQRIYGGTTEIMKEIVGRSLGL